MMAGDSSKAPYRPRPAESLDVLKKELHRRGMSDAEIASALKKKKRRKPLEFAVVKKPHLMPMQAAAKKPAAKSAPPPRPRLADELCTVEQAAAQLQVHPKTILRFIRKGTLRANRIGKSYRIARRDLDELAGVPLAPPAKRASLTSIVDVPEVGPELAQKWSTTIASALSARPSPGSPLRADVIYEPERAHLKIIVTGPPAETVNLLSLIHLWLDQLRA